MKSKAKRTTFKKAKVMPIPVSANEKVCSVCGTKENLHTRKARNGVLTVFAICNPHRGEKIKAGRAAAKKKQAEIQSTQSESSSNVAEIGQSTATTDEKQ